MNLGGCADKVKDRPENSVLRPDDETLAIELSSVINRHNTRVSRLQNFYAMGTITIRWEDDKGSHSEQGNIEVWADLPDRLAIRIYKAAIGEEFLKLGANGDQAWILDLRARPPEMVLIESAQELQSGAEDLPIRVNPRTIITFLGLAGISEDVGADSARLSDDHSIWIIPVDADSGNVELAIDRKTALPGSVIYRNENGKAEFESRLSLDRYQRLDKDDTNPMEYPHFPMRLWIDQMPPERGSISITFNEATGRKSDFRWTDKVFDLNRLLRQHEPSIRRIPEHEPG